MVALLANIIFGLFLVLVSFALASSEGTKDLNDTLQPLFRLSPGDACCNLFRHALYVEFSRVTGFFD
jgi:hypothetical protein